MRKLLFIVLSLMALPAFAQLCTPANPVLTIKPGKVAMVNGQETCVSGSCLTTDVVGPARAIAITPIATVDLGGGYSQTLTDFATVQTPLGVATLQYIPGPAGTNPGGVCNVVPLYFTVKVGSDTFWPWLDSPSSIERVQFRGNTFRSVTRRLIKTTPGLDLTTVTFGIPSDHQASAGLNWSLEGTYSPVIPGPHIDVITPSDSLYLFALFGSGFTAGDVIEIDGSVIFTKQLRDSNVWFILLPADGSVKAPFHVRLTNSSGVATQSTITEIPTTPFANY